MEASGYLTCTQATAEGRRRKNDRITKTGWTLLEAGRAKLRELFSKAIEDRPPQATDRTGSNRQKH